MRINIFTLKTQTEVINSRILQIVLMICFIGILYMLNGVKKPTWLMWDWKQPILVQIVY